MGAIYTHISSITSNCIYRLYKQKMKKVYIIRIIFLYSKCRQFWQDLRNDNIICHHTVPLNLFD